MLLDRAARAGARLEKERVLGVERAGSTWRLRTRGGEASADFVIVANGARNALRGLGAEPNPAASLLAMGYFVPARQEHLVVQFFDTFEGYIWVFPRSEHLSVGICGRGEPAQSLRRRLEAYMVEHGIPVEGATFYGHLLPTWNPGRFSGDGWMAVGDAAGTVDPITGEGIYYALRSADLAAQALLSGTDYPASVRADFGRDLDVGAGLAQRFFTGTFARKPVTTRMVQFARRSRRFGALLEDLVAGAQGYIDLRRRCYAELPRILLDMVTFR
jgi:flavin-dependent dehydrogenase